MIYLLHRHSPTHSSFNQVVNLVLDSKYLSGGFISRYLYGTGAELFLLWWVDEVWWGLCLWNSWVQVMGGDVAVGLVWREEIAEGCGVNAVVLWGYCGEEGVEVIVVGCFSCEVLSFCKLGYVRSIIRLID